MQHRLLQFMTLRGGLDVSICEFSNLSLQLWVLLKILLKFAETGEALVSSVDKMIFVGSPGVGKMVVPTVYTPLRGVVIRSNQFSVTEHYKGPEVRQHALPGVFFYCDLSGIKVNFTETRTFFLHFLTNICAIVGGVFTVAGIVDSFIYHGHKALKKKRDIGKLF